MSVKLKPCPFCGSEVIMLIRDRFIHEVLCQKCGVKSRVFPSKEQAIKWWNTRAAGWTKTSERLPKTEGTGGKE